MTELVVRHGRTGIGVPLGGLSLAMGVYGAVGGGQARSGAVESAFSDAWAIAWYIALAAGGLVLLAALARPWPTELTERTGRCMVNRLYLERGGLFVVGWMWQSYAFAALAIQGAGGATAATVSTVVGSYTYARIRAQFVDMPALRAWLGTPTWRSRFRAWRARRRTATPAASTTPRAGSLDVRERSTHEEV